MIETKEFAKHPRPRNCRPSPNCWTVYGVLVSLAPALLLGLVLALASALTLGPH